NTRCSNTSRAVPGTSSAAATSPSTSGTTTTIRFRMWWTCMSSGSAASSIVRDASRSFGPGAARGTSLLQPLKRKRTLSLRARLTTWYVLVLVAVLAFFAVDLLVIEQRIGIRGIDRELDAT